MELQRIIDSVQLLPEASRCTLMEHFTEVSFPRGEVVLRADRLENMVYMVKEGLVRAYVEGAERDITFWFGREGAVIMSMRNYVRDERSYETIATLEPCVLFAVPLNVLQGLYAADIHLANWGRKLAEAELMRTEERMIARQFRTAAERYADLCRSDPGLLQRVQLRHIASYLGITQVSLSRIRAAGG